MSNHGFHLLVNLPLGSIKFKGAIISYYPYGMTRYLTSDKTIIWYPKEGRMVPRGSKVELLRESGLVLTDPQGTQVWRSGSISAVASGFMNDTGNLVIFGSNSRKIWDSFDYPADTLLPSQVIERGGGMNSIISATNFSGGRFQLRLLQDGNLLLNTQNILSGLLSILMGSLDNNYPQNSTGNASWEVVLYIPDNICEDIRGLIDSGACGFNNVCNLQDGRPNYKCPQGFSVVNPDDPNGDCKPDFTPSCYHEGKSDNGGDVLGFIELNNTDWVFSDYGNLDPSSEQTCKSICLEDCFCAVAIYRDAKCWKKRLPLSNEIMGATDNVKAFVKYRIADGPFQNPHRLPRERKDKRSLILVVSVLLEIVSCRKSLAFESDNEGMAVLTDLAWDCYQEG
ncbi:unnamed protein product [Lactuca virosa]|uniref:Bulb-type lectin domain-containing protein n=1 Tax=Lactuca virosa TaxID=75947 RepID=A0AAU9NUI2_9ASTR|nr:unnamed protein product [Lactuca virosa]